LDKDVDMARTQNNVTPEVGERLAEVVRELRTAIYGPDGFPVWGTRFAEIEQQGMDVGLEVARLFMEQSVAGQAQAGVPDEALEEQEGEIPEPVEEDFKSTLETPAGDVHWEQPQTRLTKARRDFFPSGPSTGD
jgi:hypothetical protein